MISFECAHCGNDFRVEAGLAGRYGWCRVCKGLIIVPGKDEAPFAEWEPEEKIKKLGSILRQAGLRQERDGRYIRRMRQKMERDEAGDERIVELRETVKELRGRLEMAESHHSEVIAKLEENGADRGVLRDRLERLGADNIKLNEALGESAAELDEVRAANAAANETIERLRHELATRDGGDSSEAIQAEFDGLAKARDEAARELTLAREEIQELKSAHEEALRVSATHEAAEREAQARAESEAARAKAADDAREEQASTIEQLNAEGERLRQDVAHHEGELETLRKAIIHAKEEVDRLEQEAADRERVVAERDGLRVQLQESEVARASLAEKLGHAEARAESADDHRGEAQNRLDSALEKVARLTEELVSAVPAVTHSDVASVVADTSAVDEMKSFIEVANEARREAEKRADSMERELDHAIEEKDALAARIAEREPELQELAAARARLEESQDQVRELTRELASLAKQVAELESDGRQKDSEIQRLRNQVMGIDTDNSPPRANVEWPMADEDTLMPDLIDGDEDDDMLTNSLLRFIQPE